MDSDERIFEIELERLKDFPQHPFMFWKIGK